MEQVLFWGVPAASLLALLLAWYFYRQMMKESEGTPVMQKIALYVRQGAMSYLKQQYKIVGMVFIALVVLFSIMAYGFDLQNHWVPVAFLTGGFFSGLSGFLGMKTATHASARTANAARKSLNGGLRVAFRSGAVMGLVVVGLGLLDISFWYLILDWFVPDDPATPTAKLCMITTTMLTFGMGASTQALFARVGGGIYTKWQLTSAPTSLARLKRVFPRMIPVTLRLLPTMLATMWVMSPEWVLTFMSLIAAQFLQRQHLVLQVI